MLNSLWMTFQNRSSARTLCRNMFECGAHDLQGVVVMVVDDQNSLTFDSTRLRLIDRWRMSADLHYFGMGQRFGPRRPGHSKIAMEDNKKGPESRAETSRVPFGTKADGQHPHNRLMAASRRLSPTP